MSDQATRQANYPRLMRTDELVVVMHRNETDAYVVLQAYEEPVEVGFEVYNVIDSRDGALTGPGLDETPVATATQTLVPGGVVRFSLRDAALAPATQFNKITTVKPVRGDVQVTVVSPTPFTSYLRQPARTPIDT